MTAPGSSPPTSPDPPGAWRYPYVAQDRQAAGHRLWADERLYGGAAGGGKTEWLLAEVLAPVLRWGVNGIILRRTFRHLAQPQGIIERLRARIPRRVGTYNASKHLWTFANGALLQLGHLQHDGDVEQYMGAEFGVIGFDQLEQFTEWQYRRMIGHPLRVAEDHPAIVGGFRPYAVATANPGGDGHQWVKGRWIDPAPPNVVWAPNPTDDEIVPGSRAFIPARVEDNAYLGDAYIRRLEGLPEDDRKALRDGDWDVYAGSRFGHLWRRNVHVIDPETFPVPPGAGIPHAIGIDYGSAAPFAAYWAGLFPDGLVVVYRELYMANLSPAEQAAAILAAEHPAERAPGRPIAAYLDPSCWARNPDTPRPPPGAAHHPGMPPAGSIADTYRRNGVPVTRANNDRAAGTALLAAHLKVRADGRPRLLIHSTCTNLIRTFPGLPRDTRNPELYATTGEDHAADAVRYLLMGLVGVDAPGPDGRLGSHPAGGPRTGRPRNVTGTLAAAQF